MRAESNRRDRARSKRMAVGRGRERRRETALVNVLLVMVAALPLTSCSSTVVDKLEAARRGDPEDMREAITEIGEKLYAMEGNGIPYDEGALSAVEYLKEIVEQKVDPINRAQALSALGRLQRPEVGQLYVRSLTDSFWLVRLEAAKAIYRNPHPENAEPLVEQLKKERYVEVRIELLRALIAVGTDLSLKTVLEILLDPTGRYNAMRLKAYNGAVRLSGKTYALKDNKSWNDFYIERYRPAESIEPESPPSSAEPSGAARAPQSAFP